jgi:cathepsin B
MAEKLITLKRAKELRDIVQWKVANPKKNPLRKFTLEKFQQILKGNPPITHKAAEELKEFLPDMTTTEIKFFIESIAPVANNTMNLEVTVAGEDHVNKETRNLGEEEENKWWEEFDDWEEDDPWEYDEYDQNDNSTNNTEESNSTTGLPINFDGRKVWGKCIHSGRDQRGCNGCWAFGIANHMSDRFCIWGKDVVLSVQDVLECTEGNTCCTGGTASNGYKYMTEIGAVPENCKEFTEECGQCRNSTCPRYKCKRGSLFWANSVEEAKWEIYNNGPITSVFDVYEDLAYYAGGVYYKATDKYLGVHAVEILGWGVEDEKEYWLCKNSWGDAWGNNSFFKMKMGECGINDALTTCQPLV